jgi:hypothetical protein
VGIADPWPDRVLRRRADRRLECLAAWKGKRGWFSKLWAVLLLLASLMVLYFAVTFGLVAMTVAY